MKRNLRVLSLVFVAVLAMSAVVASAAQATQFTSSGYPATITGSQIGQDVFNTNAFELKCGEANYAGSASAASETLAINPTYGSCRLFGTLSVNINTTGCHYVFHSGALIGTDAFAGTVDIECTPATDTIDITGPGCTVTVPQQTGLTGIQYTVNTAAGDIEVDVAITGIKYTVDSGCITTKAGTFTNGTYTGKATVSGDNGPVTID